MDKRHDLFGMPYRIEIPYLEMITKSDVARHITI